MNKKNVFIILFVMLFTTLVVSLYSTFALDENVNKLDDSSADYNLVYTLKNEAGQSVNVNALTTKYIDIVLENTYEGNIKYGMYYKLLSPNKLPDNVNITLAPESKYKLQDIISVGDKRTISIKVFNNSQYNLDLVIGALVGFENGNIEELINEGEVLIK